MRTLNTRLQRSHDPTIAGGFCREPLTTGMTSALSQEVVSDPVFRNRSFPHGLQEGPLFCRWAMRDVFDVVVPVWQKR